MAFFFKAQIKRWWMHLRYGSGPQAVPKKLDTATLTVAMEAARFLNAQGVDIRSLAAEEKAGQPRPTGDTRPPGYPNH